MSLKQNQIETKRLIISPITLQDTKRLSAMYTNPNVMKYIYDGSTFSAAQIINRAKWLC